MIGYINDLIYVCAPAPLQSGVASGITELSSDYYQKLCRKFKKNVIFSVVHCWMLD